MMNGHGKSDRPTVPMKSPNKVEQLAAEGLEGRGLAKGNPRQQNAPRTPSREGAHNALERVRQGVPSATVQNRTLGLPPDSGLPYDFARMCVERTVARLFNGVK